MKDLIIAGENFGDICRRTLEEIGYNVVKVRAFGLLDAPVSSHPDMLFSIVGTDFIISRKYYEFEKKTIDFIIQSGNVNLVVSDCVQRSPYPHDIAYNVLVIHNCVIGNLKYISRDVLKSAEFFGYKCINVKQGYAACSAAKVSSNAIITADISVAEAAEAAGCDVLVILPGFIKIDGYGYGFIGGASGLIDGKLCFCGEIQRHPDYKKIHDFCGKYGVEIISLSNEDLYDCGGIIINQAEIQF